jgi:hypothetical protein
VTCQVTGTKAEMVMRLLGAFGLQGPSKAPAQLLRALLLERSIAYDAWDGPDAAVLHMSVAGCIAVYKASFDEKAAVLEAQVTDWLGLCLAMLHYPRLDSQTDYMHLASTILPRQHA